MSIWNIIEIRICRCPFYIFVTPNNHQIQLGNIRKYQKMTSKYAVMSFQRSAIPPVELVSQGAAGQITAKLLFTDIRTWGFGAPLGLHSVYPWNRMDKWFLECYKPKNMKYIVITNQKTGCLIGWIPFENLRRALPVAAKAMGALNRDVSSLQIVFFVFFFIWAAFFLPCQKFGSQK